MSRGKIVFKVFFGPGQGAAAALVFLEEISYNYSGILSEGGAEPLTILSQFQADPVGTLIVLLYQIPAVLIALTLHELSHGYVALKCGDPTAQMLGRLSFNPLRHLDPMGTAFMFLFGMGWARPVPVNPRNYRNFRRDDLLVSLAGVTMNFLLFLLAMLLMTGVNELMWRPELWQSGEQLATRRSFLSFQGYNFYSVFTGQDTIFLSVSGGWGYVADQAEYLRVPWLLYIQRFLMTFCRINLALAVFNLFPIPPLDGYHVVNDIFLRGKLHVPARVVNGLMVVMMAIMFFTNFFSTIIGAVVNFVQGGVLSALLWMFGLG